MFMIHKKYLLFNCLQSPSRRWKLNLWYFHFLGRWAAKPLAVHIHTARPILPVLLYPVEQNVSVILLFLYSGNFAQPTKESRTFKEDD